MAQELDVAEATENQLYAAMDWLLTRQAATEKRLAARQHSAREGWCFTTSPAAPIRGRPAPLARFGHDRDGKTGCPIIVYGLLTDADGRPIAVQVYPGNTGDPKTGSPTRSRR